MPTFNDRLAVAADRMNQISLYLFTQALKQPGATLEHGLFYAGGPTGYQVTYTGPCDYTRRTITHSYRIADSEVTKDLFLAIEQFRFWSYFWQDLACYVTHREYEIQHMISKFQNDHASAFYTEYRQQVMDMIDTMIEIGIPTEDNRFNALYILAGDITRLLLSIEGPQ